MPHDADYLADIRTGGRELARLSRLYEFPGFVKKASLETTAPARPSSFADPVRGQFPCHTAAATWLSALYFREKQAEFHPKDRAQIGERLDRFVKYHGIGAAVNSMRTRWDELHKTAEEQLPDSAYAWVWEGEDGRKERRLKLSSAMEVKVAAEWLAEHRDRIPFRDRNTIAIKILEKQSHFGASVGNLQGFLETQAGRGVPDPQEVVAMIRQRADLARDPAVKDAVTKLAAVVRSTPERALMPEQLVKLAETVDDIDRGLGLVGKYGELLRRPEEVIFGVLYSKAAEEAGASVQLANGSVFAKESLAHLKLEDLDALFGADFTARVTDGFGVDIEKCAAEVEQLEDAEAALVESLLRDCGASPAYKAAAAPARFTTAQFHRLAAAYTGE